LIAAYCTQTEDILPSKEYRLSLSIVPSPCRQQKTSRQISLLSLLHSKSSDLNFSSPVSVSGQTPHFTYQRQTTLMTTPLACFLLTPTTSLCIFSPLSRVWSCSCCPDSRTCSCSSRFPSGHFSQPHGMKKEVILPRSNPHSQNYHPPRCNIARYNRFLFIIMSPLYYYGFILRLSTIHPDWMSR